MIERISKTEEFLEQMKREGKVKYYNTKEDYERMEKMNEELEKVRREYMIKDYNSQIEASKMIFTA
jgi:uncharacterized protein YxeA